MTVASDQAHIAMSAVLPIVRRDIAVSLGTNGPTTFEGLCQRLSAVHPSAVQLLLDALQQDGEADTDGSLYWLTTEIGA